MPVSDGLQKGCAIIMTAQELLDQAIIELGNLKDGTTFIVKDLFKGHLWNAQDKKERLTLGTLFLNFVKQNQGKIEVLDKNSSGQQEYKLVDGWSFKPLAQKNCFEKTGIIEIKTIEHELTVAIIGTSGLDRCEIPLQSVADIEKLTSILTQTIIK